MTERPHLAMARGETLSRKALVLIWHWLPWPLMSSVTLGRSLNLSEPVSWTVIGMLMVALPLLCPSSTQVRRAQGNHRWWLLFLQVCQVSAQQPVQTELLMRYHQLQSRLATLKIENEEVSEPLCPIRDFLWKAWLVPRSPLVPQNA